MNRAGADLHEQVIVWRAVAKADDKRAGDGNHVAWRDLAKIGDTLVKPWLFQATIKTASRLGR